MLCRANSVPTYPNAGEGHIKEITTVVNGADSASKVKEGGRVESGRVDEAADSSWLGDREK